MSLPSTGDPNRRITINRSSASSDSTALNAAIAPGSVGATSISGAQSVAGSTPAMPANHAAEATLLAGLNRAAETSSDFNGLLRNVASTLAKNAHATAIWLVSGNHGGNQNGTQGGNESHATNDMPQPPAIDRVISLFGSEANGLWEAYSEQAAAIGLRSWASDTLEMQPIKQAPHAEFCAMPLDITDGKASIIGVFNRNETGSESSLTSRFVVSHVAACIQRWCTQSSLHLAQSSVAQLTELNRQSQLLGQAKSKTDALIMFVNSLRTLTGSMQVALATGESSDKLRIAAISDVESFDPGNELCNSMRDIIAEAVSKEQTISLSSLDEPASVEVVSDEATPVDYLRLSASQSCAAICLKGVATQSSANEKTIGGLLISFDSPSNIESHQLARVEQLATQLARQLSIVLRSFQSTREKIKTTAKIQWQRRSVQIGIGIAIACSLVLCIPRPMSIDGKCEMQPVLRRFVAAPHDGILQSALVETGDVVQEGQVLAELDGRQLRIELASLSAEFNSQRKQRDAALAVKDVSLSQIASLEMRRLQAEIDLVQRQLMNLEIISPVSGVVITGDLEKAEGAPLTTGQNLFEISPLDELLAEVAIHEGEIQNVREGMTVRVKLDAFPFETFTGTIEKLSPQAELLNSESVFVAVVRFENELGKLKPGMKGRAVVRSDQFPLVWHLARKPWEQFRRLLVW